MKKQYKKPITESVKVNLYGSVLLAIINSILVNPSVTYIRFSGQH